MSTMGRQYTEVCESVLPNVPKIDCLVSKLALEIKTIQLILLYSCFCYSLGAKSENLSSVAPPGKRNSIDTICKVYVYGAWKTMFY